MAEGRRRIRTQLKVTDAKFYLNGLIFERAESISVYQNLDFFHLIIEFVKNLKLVRRTYLVYFIS